MKSSWPSQDSNGGTRGRNAPFDRSREEQKQLTQMRGGEDPRRSRSVTSYHWQGQSMWAGCRALSSPFQSFTYPFPLDPQQPPSRRRTACFWTVTPLATPWPRGSTPWRPNGGLSTALNSGSIRSSTEGTTIVEHYTNYSCFFPRTTAVQQ
jgi:hypothetical protein